MSHTKKLIEETLRLRSEATQGEWVKYNVFGSKDLPGSILVETNLTENIAGVECPIHNYICEVHPDGKNLNKDFWFIIHAANNIEKLSKALELAISKLQIYADNPELSGPAIDAFEKIEEICKEKK